MAQSIMAAVSWQPCCQDMANDDVKENHQPAGHAHGDELDDALNETDSILEALFAQVPDTDDGATTAADANAANDSPPTGPAADPGTSRRGLLKRVYTRVF